LARAKFTNLSSRIIDIRKDNGRSDPKAEKKAIQDIPCRFAGFENRMKPRLKLADTCG